MTLSTRLGIAAGVGIALVVVGGSWLRKGDPDPPRPIVTLEAADGSTLATDTEPARVFEKAFWSRPGPDDRITGAERREWAVKDGGVRKWQWFLSVEPSAKLRDYLAGNPFGLAEVPAADRAGALAASLAGGVPPEWFPKEVGEFRVWKHLSGSFLLLMSADGKALHATDSGLGFAPPDKKS